MKKSVARHVVYPALIFLEDLAESGPRRSTPPFSEELKERLAGEHLGSFIQELVRKGFVTVKLEYEFAITDAGRKRLARRR